VDERFTELELGEILRRAAERSGDAWRAIDAARTGTE
jgi:hypothetical protein